MTRSDSEITQRVRVVEFRPRPTNHPSSEPRVLVGPVIEPPAPGDARREEEVTRPIRRA